MAEAGVTHEFEDIVTCSHFQLLARIQPDLLENNEVQFMRAHFKTCSVCRTWLTRRAWEERNPIVDNYDRLQQEVPCEASTSRARAARSSGRDAPMS